MNTTFSPRTKYSARAALSVIALLAISGAVLGWNRGQLPHGASRRAAEDALNASYAAPTGVDLQLYEQVIADVRGGRGYYAVAGEKLPQFGFPTSSPFNWRLPTYAWLLAMLPDNH